VAAIRASISSRTDGTESNALGLCARCSKALESQSVSFADGLAICPACANVVRIRTILGLALVTVLLLTAVTGATIAVHRDVQMNRGSNWDYLIPIGLLVFSAALVGSVGLAVTRRNRRAQRAFRLPPDIKFEVQQ
jgi:hypothetical protein